MKNKIFIIFVGLAIFLSSSIVFAQEEIQLEGPLAGAPACHNCKELRQGRVFITPTTMFTILDDYRRHYFVGLSLEYHFLDWLGVRATGAYAGILHYDTTLANDVANKSPLGMDTNRVNYPFNDDSTASSEAKNLFGTLNWYASLELMFIPFRGKFSLFGRFFMGVDLYLYAGYAVVGVEERGNVDCRTVGEVSYHEGNGSIEDDSLANSEQCPDWNSSIERQSYVALSAGTYGGGILLYFNDFIGLSVEYRITPFAWNRSGTDERGVSGEFAEANNGEQYLPYDSNGEFPDGRINEDDRLWNANHMVTVGLTFAFPIHPNLSE